MDAALRKEITEYLSGFVTEDRLDRIEQVLKQRTRHLTVVLEDIYQSHNASAVLRSCDGFGIQDVHIIENRNSFDASSGVTIGADRWLSLHRYKKTDADNTRLCLDHLKKQGYTIVATTPHTEDVAIQELPVEGKTALVFGAEQEGLSDRALELADVYVKIPMFGFSESFNISVSAALCLYDFTSRMRSSELDWELAEHELQQIRYSWIRKSIKAGTALEKQYLSENHPDYLGRR